MLPVIETFKKRCKLKQLVIVSVAGLMLKENVKELTEKGYKFIIGARIKNESAAMKKQILSLQLSDGQSMVFCRNKKIKE